VRLRACNGQYLKPARVQRGGNAADVAALARGVPALVRQNYRHPLAVQPVMQFTQALLCRLQPLFVFVPLEALP